MKLAANGKGLLLWQFKQSDIVEFRTPRLSSFILRSMASPQLSNYLRAHRKRLGLSQKEVAYLLGAESGAKVCRYERFARDPGLETALAYEALFQKPVSELLAGLYQKIEKQVAARAKALAGKPGPEKSNRQSARKQATLANLAGHLAKKSFNKK